MINNKLNYLKGKKILVTGHTGFKGAWLCIFLKILKAKIYGLSLEPPTNPSLYEEAKLSNIVENNLININFKSWLLILHSAIFVSIGAHMSMFYLYKIYPVNKVFPFYALFPIFGILQTMVIFNEIPTLIVFVGGLIVITSIYLLNKLD